jgi:glutathione S-transferase
MLTLFGYRYSVYLRIVRLVLAEKGLTARHVEIDPFSALSTDFMRLHPFGRVPVLDHDRFVVYETAAITRYLDEAFEEPPLQPVGAQARARMVQIVAIANAYAYWPLVRQVYAQAVFGPADGQATDRAELAKGLASAPRVLAALEVLVAEGLWTGSNGGDQPVTLADLHLAPMIGAFAAAPQGANMLGDYPALARWWAQISARPSWAATDAGLPNRHI